MRNPSSSHHRLAFLLLAAWAACGCDSGGDGSPADGGTGANTAGTSAGGNLTGGSGGTARGGTAGDATAGAGGASGGTMNGGTMSGGAAGGAISNGGMANGGIANGGTPAAGGSAGATAGGSTGAGASGGPTAGASGSGGADPGTHWVGTWGTGLQATEPRNLPTPVDDAQGTPENPGFSGNTLRQIVRVSMGGSKLRLRLSNEYGLAPVTFEAVHVAKPTMNGAIDKATDTAVTFASLPNVTVEAGKHVVSDPFDYTLAPLSQLAITIKFGAQSKEVTGHPGSRTNSYVKTGGSVTDSEMTGAIKTPHWYFIEGLDVQASDEAGAVVVLGDSLTDGRGSTTDGNDRWTDTLANRLQANAATRHVAVVNQGIGGNAVLSGGIGPVMKMRFDHDVLGTPGVKWLIVLAGVNDIGSATTDVTVTLIAAYQEFVTKAKAQSVKTFGVPILPFKTSMNYDTGDHLAQRKKVNDWIRMPGSFDAVIDLDMVVRDPADPDKLLETYATLPASVGTDFLHLNPAGYKAMGDAVQLTLFE